MSILKIITEPDPVLRKKCLPVEKIDKNLRSLMDDMIETMYAANGIGLAAIQIGFPQRIIVMDIRIIIEKKVLFRMYSFNLFSLNYKKTKSNKRGFFQSQ